MEHNNVSDVSASNNVVICDNCNERSSEISYFLYYGDKTSGRFTFSGTKSVNLCKECAAIGDQSDWSSRAKYSAIFGAVLFTMTLIWVATKNYTDVVRCLTCFTPTFFLIAAVFFSMFQRWMVGRGHVGKKPGLNLAKRLTKASVSNSGTDFTSLTAEELSRTEINVTTTHTKPQLPAKCINCANPLPTSHQMPSSARKTFTISFKDKVGTGFAKLKSITKNFSDNGTTSTYQIPYRDSVFEVSFELCDQCLSRLKTHSYLSDYVKTYTAGVSIPNSYRRSDEVLADYIDWGFKNFDYAREFETLNSHIRK